MIVKLFLVFLILTFFFALAANDYRKIKNKKVEQNLSAISGLCLIATFIMAILAIIKYVNF